MCGIAGLIHRGGSGDIGHEMTAMLQSLKHRGPDSTGYALYGKPDGGGESYVLRFKVAEQEDMKHGFKIHDQVRERRADLVAPVEGALALLQILLECVEIVDGSLDASSDDHRPRLTPPGDKSPECTDGSGLSGCRAMTEDRRTDAHMRRTEHDRGGKIGAHPHRQ